MQKEDPILNRKKLFQLALAQHCFVFQFVLYFRCKFICVNSQNLSAPVLSVNIALKDGATTRKSMLQVVR